MKIRAAVLDAPGAATPYAETRPLAIRTLDLQRGETFRLIQDNNRQKQPKSPTDQ